MKNYELILNSLNISIPDNWELQVNDEIASIYKAEYGAGVIQISSFSVPDDYIVDTRQELLEFVKEHFQNFEEPEIQKIELEEMNIASLKLSVKERFWLFRIISKDKTVIFITYNCLKLDEEKEMEAINSIFSSIKVLN